MKELSLLAREWIGALISDVAPYRELLSLN